VQRELHECYDSEVAASTPKAPQKVRVLVCARRENAAIGRDHFRRHQVVATETVFVPQPANPTIQRQAGDTGMGDDPSRCCEAEGLGFAIDVAPRRAALDTRNPAVAINGDTVHLRNVDHQTVIANGVAGYAVAAGANCCEQMMPSRKPNGIDDIRNAATTRDNRGTTIEHSVENDSGPVILWIAREE
jgi:hypothetical protein